MIKIRRARREDAPSIHEAHMRSIREICAKDYSAEEIQGWGHRPYDESLRHKAIEQQLVWVLCSDEIIEGYAHMSLIEKEGIFSAYIYGLYLSAQVAQQGWGKQMLQLMIEEARNFQACEIHLLSTVTAQNFYKKFGFIGSGPMRMVSIGGSDVRCFPMCLKISGS